MKQVNVISNNKGIIKLSKKHKYDVELNLFKLPDRFENIVFLEIDNLELSSGYFIFYLNNKEYLVKSPKGKIVIDSIFDQLIDNIKIEALFFNQFKISKVILTLSCTKVFKGIKKIFFRKSRRNDVDRKVGNRQFLNWISYNI